MKEIVNVFWTGGLDSTCRIAELSKLDVIIQPYYIIEVGRTSFQKEIKAIQSISNTIRLSPDTIGKLNDVIIIHESQLAKKDEYTKAWEVLYEKYKLGSQYALLARFAREKDLILEVSIENSPRSKAHKALDEESKLKIVKKGELEEYSIDQQNSSKEAILLFENIRFPKTIWNLTKLEEVEKIKKMGLECIIHLTWFCHRPILGLTCGHCNPCKDAINEGMSCRVSRIGFFLGAIRKYTYDLFMSKYWKYKRVLINKITLTHYNLSRQQ